jgi:hypothetical protein
VADALSDIRNSGRAWPPTAPEFRSICLMAGKDKPMPLEAAYAEICQHVRSGKNDRSNLSPIVYHTVTKKLDLYNFRLIEEWKALKMFEMAYKATLFQIECGEELLTPPKPETLLPKPERKDPTEKDKEKASEIIGGLLAMFDQPEPTPLTQDEINDLQRIERIRNEN